MKKVQLLKAVALGLLIRRGIIRKQSAHARAVMGSAGFGWCYGENACTGGRQGLPSMRSCRTSMAFLPCLRAVSR